MGHKKVCIECRLVFNRNFDSGSELTYPCPKCRQSMLLLPHRFRPPKKTDEKGWQVVKFLLEHGFSFQHLYEERSSDYSNKPSTTYAPYPKNLREAKEFVETYKEQAR